MAAWAIGDEEMLHGWRGRIAALGRNAAETIRDDDFFWYFRGVAALDD